MTLDSAIAATSDAFGAVSHCLYMVPSIYLITVAPWNLYDEIRNPPVTQGADSLLHAKLVGLLFLSNLIYLHRLILE